MCHCVVGWGGCHLAGAEGNSARLKKGSYNQHVVGVAVCAESPCCEPITPLFGEMMRSFVENHSVQ